MSNPASPGDVGPDAFVITDDDIASPVKENSICTEIEIDPKKAEIDIDVFDCSNFHAPRKLNPDGYPSGPPRLILSL